MRGLLAAVLSLTFAAAGCGGGDTATIKVSAAASLKPAFERYGRAFHGADVSFSFAGSDELAAQIRQGVKPDAFAAASQKLPDDLHAKGLVRKPVAFATNTLVVGVPTGSTAIRSIGDLARPGVRVATGAAEVPIGSYARAVLGRLPGSEARAIARNIRSNEPDVAGVVAKVAAHAVDAGLVYATDVKASDGRLAAIRIPARLQPAVTYGAAVVDGAAHPGESQRFVDGLRTGAGRQALAAAGFGPPPR